MISLPEVNKRNWKKVLRELDIVKFPSLSPALIELRRKFKAKEDVPYHEEALGYARLVKYFEQYAREINSLYIQTIDWSKFDARPPLEHQKVGVEFLLKNNKCILGDDMGLGKSATCIMSTLLMDQKMQVLVVTLKSLKYNFYKEVRFFSDDVVVVDKKWDTAKFTIIHYDALKKWKKELLEKHFDVVILDEAHKVRNHKTQRTKSVMEVINAHKPVKLWLMTGTPVDNRPIDYYQLLKMIKHPIAKNWVTFVTRYCEGRQNAWGQWETNGASNLNELHMLTKDVFLRRLKTNTKGINLPEKTRKSIFVELKNRKGYNNCVNEYEQLKLEELKEDGFDVDEFQAEEMTRLLLERQFCALEKVKDGTLIELAENLIEENEENKIIIFTNFRAVVDAVMEHFKAEAVFIDGRILDPKKRLDTVDRFNADPKLKVFVINMKAGGTGLNITGANKEIVNDMDWVPSTMLQAEDRAWRIGQTRDVEVIYPIYDETVETVLYDVITKKMQIISTIVEGKEEDYFNDLERQLAETNSADEKKSILDAIFKQMGL